MADTKQDLIKKLSDFPTETLRKLLNYANLIVIPDEDLVSNVTMQQIVDKAHDLADIHFPEWTDRSKSDFGEFLVELFALFSEKDFWYINAFANESILTKMRSYSNAYSKAVSMGYTPRVTTPATVSVILSFSDGNAETIPIGGIILNINGKEYFNASTITIEANTTKVTAMFTQGKHNVETYTFNGYCIFIRQDKINPASINLAIGGVGWNKVTSFGNATNTSEVFVVVPEDDGSAAIYFGSNGVGKTPDIGVSVEVTYDTCDGADGAVSGSEVSIGSSTSTRTLLGAYANGESTSGYNPESLQSLVANAQLYVSNHGAVINEKAGEQLLNSFDFIYQSKVIVSGRIIHYYVIPLGRDQATAKQKDYMAINFDPKILMGYTAQFTSNDFVNLLSRLNTSKIRVEVYYFRNYNENSIKNQVLQIVQDYTNPQAKATYGGGFVKSEIDGDIRSRVSGVQKITFKVLKDDGTYDTFQDVELSNFEIFNIVDSANIEVMTYVID